MPGGGRRISYQPSSPWRRLSILPVAAVGKQPAERGDGHITLDTCCRRQIEDLLLLYISHRHIWTKKWTKELEKRTDHNTKMKQKCWPGRQSKRTLAQLTTSKTVAKHSLNWRSAMRWRTDLCFIENSFQMGVELLDRALSGCQL